MRLFKAMFLTAFISTSFQATADQIINLGNLTPPASLTYGNSFSQAASGTTFYDDYIFSIPDSTFSSSVTSSINLGTLLGISNLQARIYSGSNHITDDVTPTLIQAWGNPVTIAPGISSTTVVLNPTSPLTTGTYTLQLRGLVSGTAGGSYAGVLNVAPVPEPDSLAMLICGLGLMGINARRKVKSL
jgi:hypothetical protein